MRSQGYDRAWPVELADLTPGGGRMRYIIEEGHHRARAAGRISWLRRSVPVRIRKPNAREAAQYHREMGYFWGHWNRADDMRPRQSGL